MEMDRFASYCSGGKDESKPKGMSLPQLKRMLIAQGKINEAGERIG